MESVSVDGSSKEKVSVKGGKLKIIQAVLGTCLAVGLIWLFMPRFGEPEYDAIQISEVPGSIISDYKFGKITIVGKTYYDLDVIIFPDRVKYGWSGMKDHGLYPDEIEDVLKEDVDTVVIGNGSQGDAFIMKETVQKLESKGIKVHVLDTYDAVDLYNRLPKKRLVGLFHLTE